MSDELDFLLRAALVLVGVGAALHYFLMTNFIVAAPHWLRAIALPCAVGPAVGMVYCGLFGAVLVGMLCSLATSAAMILIQLEAWREGAHVSEQLAKAAHFRRNQQAIIRDWVTGVDPYVEMELQRQKAKREQRHEHVAGG